MSFGEGFASLSLDLDCVIHEEIKEESSNNQTNSSNNVPDNRNWANNDIFKHQSNGESSMSSSSQNFVFGTIQSKNCGLKGNNNHNYSLSSKVMNGVMKKRMTLNASKAEETELELQKIIDSIEDSSREQSIEDEELARFGKKKKTIQAIPEEQSVVQSSGSGIVINREPGEHIGGIYSNEDK